MCLFTLTEGPMPRSTTIISCSVGAQLRQLLCLADLYVSLDLNNEPHDIPAAQVYETMQAAVNAIRAGGATKQLIVVEGTSWTGAWSEDSFDLLKVPLLD